MKGKKIYDILKTFVDTKIQMRAEKEDWSKTEDKVIFKAIEKPIKTFLCQGVKEYHDNTNHMDYLKKLKLYFEILR